MIKTYHVKEIFPTIQGEGHHAGKAAVFVRFVACNMWSGYDEDRARDADRNKADCPMWCDTDFTKEGANKYNALYLASKVAEHNIPHVVLTGGEPFLQVDPELVTALHDKGLYVQVETNGTQSLAPFLKRGRLRGLPDWITVSPKVSDDRTRIELCHEVKLVMPDYHPSAYPFLTAKCVPQIRGGRTWQPLFIQPVDYPDSCPYEEVARACADYVLANPEWRVSVQTHKILQVA